MGGPEERETRARETLERSLIAVAVEGWRFAKAFQRALEKLDASEAARHLNQVRYYLRKLEGELDAAGLRLVTLEGQPYDPGMAVTALNGEDFDPDERLVVEGMIEPVVMGVDGVRRPGVVTLGKGRAA